MSGLDQWMRDREENPPDDKVREKALDEWMTEQKRLEEMTPAERERHERELRERRRGKRDDDGYGLEISYEPTNQPKRGDDGDLCE